MHAPCLAAEIMKNIHYNLKCRQLIIKKKISIYFMKALTPGIMNKTLFRTYLLYFKAIQVFLNGGHNNNNNIA